ncbi:MGMT family protein [Gordonia jinhuaensis]|uniref:DNA methyltransferase n=1 Tax=Gordonia jinhuaensis TaxID=1517702 RepID=A0A916T7P1_9ACTN|nr:MGMT family protein [Gordonia jinhuaensis]GGB34793.1 DNA methyltransferase [Gordonia jinhuaensis]
MAAITDEDVERVRALVVSVPTGSVTTYGDLAAAAGLSSPRVAATIMRTDSADIPWHRVLPVSGIPAPHLRERQLSALRADGVPITDGRVVMRVARHRFD